MTEEEIEIPLEGGNMNAVVRVGNTVRRRMGPWSPAVYELLRHVRSAGFNGAPELLGVDAADREVLRFEEGELALTANPAFLWADTTLAEAGRMLREFHDAQSELERAQGDTWNAIGREPDGVWEVVCHNDFTPYNCICHGGRLVAMIDFDLAAPGSRVWDLAWSAINWVPLFDPVDHPRQRPDPPETGRRLRHLMSAYGMEDMTALVGAMRRRIDHLLVVSEERRRAGDPWAIATESHLPFWRRARDFIEATHPLWL